MVLGCLGGPDVQSPYKKQAEESKLEKDVSVELQVGVMPFEDGGRNHEPGNAGRH